MSAGGWKLVDRRAAVRALPEDGYVRYAVPDDALVVRHGDAWAWLHRWRPHGHWGGGAFGDPTAYRDGAEESDALAVLTAEAARRGVWPEWFSTAPGRDLRGPDGFTLDGAETWEFWWTADEPPPAPTAREMRELDDAADADEIQEFGARHNPAFEGFPGRGFASLWLAAHDDTGQLAAVGANHHLATGAPHLSGIVVRPDRRGLGLGRRITAELTRRAVQEHGVATLGVYADNRAALRLYESLGFRKALTLHTRGLVPEGDC